MLLVVFLLPPSQQALPNIVCVIIWREGLTLVSKGLMGSSGMAKMEPLAIVKKALTFEVEGDGLSQPTFIPDLQVRRPLPLSC